MISESTREQLKQVGVAIHDGGLYYDPITAIAFKTPFVALRNDSEEPTAEELALLEAVKSKMAFWQVHEPVLEAANTATLVKDGKWRFRRMSWTEGPTWFPVDGTTLAELVKSKL